MILIISSDQDSHARIVLERVKSEGKKAILLDLSKFPRESQLSLKYKPGVTQNVNALGDSDLDLSACNVVWWRRPQYFVLHPEIKDPGYRSFAFGECYEAFSGLWLSLDSFWVNHPMKDEEATHKAYQLKVAQEIGLEIPSTLITNNPEHARSFIDHLSVEKTIYKSFSATEQNWRETRLLKPEEMVLLDSVRFAPVIFQEFIPAQLDLRVTMIGEKYLRSRNLLTRNII